MVSYPKWGASSQNLSNGSQNSPQSGEIKLLPIAKFSAALQAIFFQFEVIWAERVKAGALTYGMFSRSQSFSRLSWSPLAMPS